MAAQGQGFRLVFFLLIYCKEYLSNQSGAVSVVCAEEKTAPAKTEEAEQQPRPQPAAGAARRAGPSAPANPFDFSTMMNLLNVRCLRHLPLIWLTLNLQGRGHHTST